MGKHRAAAWYRRDVGVWVIGGAIASAILGVVAYAAHNGAPPRVTTTPLTGAALADGTALVIERVDRAESDGDGGVAVTTAYRVRRFAPRTGAGCRVGSAMPSLGLVANVTGSMRTQPPGAAASGQPEQLKGVRRNMARVMADARDRVVQTTLVDDADLVCLDDVLVVELGGDAGLVDERPDEPRLAGLGRRDPLERLHLLEAGQPDALDPQHLGHAAAGDGSQHVVPADARRRLHGPQCTGGFAMVGG